MPHVEPDRLALVALGEHRGWHGVRSAAHRASCATCRRELAGLRAAVGLAREAAAHRDPPQAPEHVWARIAGAASSRALVTSTGTMPPPAPAGPARERARNRWVRTAVALAAAAAAGAVGTLVAARPPARDGGSTADAA